MESSLPRWAIAAALALILALHLAATVRLLPRALDHDEGEHLRTSAFLASGRTLYRDFVENHTPFLYMIVAPFAPRGNPSPAALRSYVELARLLAALAGTLAALCVCAFAFRVCGRPLAAVATAVVLLAVSATSFRAIFDFRPEALTLLLFWAGLGLLISDRGWIASGIGLGLVAGAALWNPKWPGESLIAFAWFVRSFVENWRIARRRALMELALAAALPALMFVAALRVTTPADFIFFPFVYTAAFYKWFAVSPVVVRAFQIHSPFEYCPPWFHPLWAVVIVAAVLLSRIVRKRTKDALLWTAIALVVAGGLEIRFLYSYPQLWPQYFVMWACSVAVFYGLLAGEIAALGPRPAAAVLVTALVLFCTLDGEVVVDGVDQGHWKTKAFIHDQLRPGEAAWVSPDEYPAAVPAGSYYWYATWDQVPFSLEYARRWPGSRFLPRLQDSDMPPCRVLRALQSGAAPASAGVRFMDENFVHSLPASAACFHELQRLGVLHRIGATTVCEVGPPAR